MKKLQNLTLDYVDIKCAGEECYGYVAVQRINFALGVFHAIMALILVGVRSSKDGRAPIQNGFWGPKILAWIGLIVVTFFIPNSFFIVWGNYFALIGACLFLLIGLILLVDLAHNWAEYCQEKIETTESRVWTGLLVGSALSMYLASLAMTIVMYIFFARSGCSMNQAAITVRWSSKLFCCTRKLTSVDQLPTAPRGFHCLCSPRRSIREPPSRPCPVRYGRSLLHVSDHVRCRHGTRRHAMQSSGSSSRHPPRDYCHWCHRHLRYRGIYYHPRGHLWSRSGKPGQWLLPGQHGRRL